MSSFPRHRFSALADLGPDEKAALEKLVGEPVFIRRNQVIRHEGDASPKLYLLLRGWVGGGIRLSDGNRQFLKIHMAGDVLGAPSLPLLRAADTLVALTDARISAVRLNDLGAIFERFPRVGALLFLIAQEERITLMDRLVSLGRLAAHQRLALLLVHLHERLVSLSPQTGIEMELPLSQEQIGDAIGLTSASVNRAFRFLEAEGLIRRAGKIINLADIEQLRSLACLPRREIQRNLRWLPKSALGTKFATG